MCEARCVHCDSKFVEPGNVQSTGYIYFRPTNARFLTMKTADIRVHARMCLNCGVVQLVGDPAKVRTLMKHLQTEGV